jgi:hypothetical protein
MAHSLLRAQIAMPSPRNDDDFQCSCRHPACTITSLWRRASAARAEEPAVPEPLPFDLSDTVVTEIGCYRVPAPSPVPPPPLRPARRVA